MDQVRTFKYEPTLLVSLNRFFSVFSLGALIVLAFVFFRALRRPIVIEEILTLSALWLYCFPWAVLFSFHFPSVQVSESQLVVRSLMCFPIKLDWSEVTRVYACQPIYHGYRGQIEAMWIVETDRLTVSHRLFVYLFTKRCRPGFMVASNLPGYEDLLKIIIDHIETKQMDTL